jgi:hypothetical protein
MHSSSLKLPEMEPSAVGSSVGVDLIKGLRILKFCLRPFSLRTEISKVNGRVHMVVRMQVGDN